MAKAPPTNARDRALSARHLRETIAFHERHDREHDAAKKAAGKRGDKKSVKYNQSHSKDHAKQAEKARDLLSDGDYFRQGYRRHE